MTDATTRRPVAARGAVAARRRGCASATARCGTGWTWTSRPASSSPCSGPTAPGKTTPAAGAAGAAAAVRGRRCGSAGSRRARQPGHRLRAAAEGARRRTCRCAAATSSASASTATGWASGCAAGRSAATRVRRGAGVRRCGALRGRAGRTAVRRRAAAAPGGAGAGRRPLGAALRRAAALARPRPPAGRREPHRRAATRGRHRRVFVTHEINPVLPLVDRVLYLVDGRFRVGTPDEVMTSATLSSSTAPTSTCCGCADGSSWSGRRGAHCHPEEAT